MLKLLLILPLLALGACAQLTGDPAKDCLASRNAALQAQQLVTATAAAAVAYPNSAKVAAAAVAAVANLTAAQAQITALCKPAI